MMRRSTGRPTVRGLRRRPTTMGLRVESLESRQLMAIITVNTTADTNLRDNVLTLREAIQLSNNDGSLPIGNLSAAELALVSGSLSSPNTIEFSIGSGFASIQLGSALPAITSPVIIDGTSQPGFAGLPVIELNGNAQTGLTVASPTTISSLVFNRFTANALTLTGSNNRITGSYFGTNAGGTAALANTGDGITLIGSSSNTIGGTTANAGNLISGNGGNGISIRTTGPTTSDFNLVAGNRIGLNAAGTAKLANAANGISVDGGKNNTIGGATALARNVISGNGSTAVNVSANQANTSGTVVAGNYIGTNATGTTAIGNGFTAITVAAAGAFTITNTTIGGIAANVVSGSVGVNSGGITISGTGVTGTQIQGNFIGTNATGTAALPNGSAGIFLTQPGSVTVGGTTVAARNVISGNTGHGISLSNTTGVLGTILVEGNYIGTTADGSTALGNASAGIRLLQTGNVQIGSSVVGAGNVISGNGGAGIISSFGTAGNLIQGNLIGVNSAGTLAIGNTQGGIVLTNSALNTIGGAAAGAGNVISGNNVANTAGIDVRASDSTTIQGNSIGTNASGLFPIPNFIGISLSSNSNIVTGNVISGNTTDGVVLKSTFGNGNGNALTQNMIGVDVTGTAPLGNGGFGVNIIPSFGNVANNTVGGTTVGLGNVIANNTSGGVRVATANVANGILGNSIFQNNNLKGIKVGNSTGPVAVVNSAVIGNSQTFIQGTYGVGTGSIGSYRFEFFSNPDSGNGQGKTFLGTASRPGVTGGTIDFSTVATQFAVSSPTVLLGDYVTVTVTDPSNNTSEFSVPVQTTVVSNFTLSVAGTPDPTLVGSSTTYTITVFNAGPSPATNVMVTNTAPAGSTIIGVSPIAGTVTAGLVTTFNLGTIGAGATSTATVTVNQGIVGTATDSASLTYSGTTYNASTSVQVQSSANLGITATASPAAPNNLGDHIVYNAIVTNAGPSTALDVRVTDILPPSLQFSSITITRGGVSIGSFTQSGQTITAFLGDVAPNSAQILVSIDAIIISAGNGVKNTLSVASFGGSTDSNPGNNSVTITRNFTRSADLAVTGITASGPLLPSPPFDGTALINQNLTFTITVTNNGPSPALNASMDFALPALFGYVYISGSTTAVGGSVGLGGSGVLANLGDMASGDIETITIIVNPTATGQFDVTATAHTTTIDPSPLNDSASLSVNVQPVSNLNVVVIAQPSPVIAGQVLTYTVTVTNNGPSIATNVSLIDTLPPSVTNILVSPSQGTFTLVGNTVTANFGTIPIFGNATIQIFVTPTSGGQISNQVDVFSPDSRNVSGVASVTTLTTVTPSADLAVTTALSSPSPIGIGQPETFVITVTNNGPSPATNVALANLLPSSGFLLGTYVVSQGTASIAATTITALFGTINPGSFATLTIPITPNALGSITNTATVKSDAADLVVANNTSTVVVRVNPSADLAIVAAPVPASVIRGSTLTYSFTVTNNGPSQSDGVILTNALPTGATFVGATTSQGTFVQSGSNVIVSIGSLIFGQSATITVMVVPTVAGTYTNTATVTAATIDYTQGNNSVSQTTTVAGLAGSLQFSSANYSVGENAGSIAVTVQRVGGTAGQVTVNYTTGGGTAIANYNYTAVSGTLSFADGETSKTIIVPVLDDRTPDNGTTLGIQLNTPGLGGSLGTISNATIAILDTNSNLIPGPRVVSVQRAGTGSTLQVVITFDNDMNVAAVQNVLNYHITTLGRPPRRGAPAPTISLPIKSAVYDSATRTVTLTVGTKVNINAAFNLTVIGTFPAGVSSSKGVLLDGARTGFNGTNFVTPLDAIDPRFARIWAQYLKSRLPKIVTTQIRRR